MNEIRTKLIRAKKENSFLKAVYVLSLGDLNNPKMVAAEIANLHNDKQIDAISEFGLLSKESYKDIEFFLIIEVFKNALPHIHASVCSVMLCIKCLNKEEIVDQFEPSFTDFCSLNPSHPKEAIELIEKFPTQWRNFLISSIVAGANLDIEHYSDLAIQLTCHEDIEIKKRAIIALGKISYSNNLIIVNQAFESLQSLITKENDGHLLQCLMKAIFKLYLADNSLENKIIKEIHHLLGKKDEHVNSAASELFHNIDQLPNKLLDILITHLRNIPILDKDILIRIDSGIVQLLKRGETNRSLHFLENLLTRQSEKLDIDKFQLIISECLSSSSLFNKIITRWLLKGDATLCTALLKIIVREQQNYPKICADELRDCKEKHFIFIAQKALGYFFSCPLSAASIIVSLINYIKDKTPNALVELLFDPLLINYPSEVGQYLKELLEESSETTKNFIREILERFDIYLLELNAAGEVKELHPSEDQREADYRHHLKIKYALSKKVKNHSPLLSMIHKTYILFGNKIVSYTYDLNQQPNRIEIPLQHLRITTEIPMLSFFDPIGIEYKLHLFRSKELSS